MSSRDYKKERKATQKNLKKYQKEYEQMLREKADLGILSMNEKEDYQRMCHGKRRERAVTTEKARVIAMRILAVIIFFGGTYVIDKWQGREAWEGRSQLTIVPKHIAEKNATIEAMNHLAEAMNEQYEVINKGIAAVQTDKTVISEYIVTLQELVIVSDQKEIATLQSIYDEIRRTGETLLMYLQTTTQVDTNYTQILIDKLNSLTKEYNEEQQRIIQELEL